MLRVVLFSLLLFSAQSGLPAQSTGTLTGHVRDQFEAVIINAVVTVTNDNGVQRKSVTDQLGRYTFSGLAPGSWVLRVEAPGFAPFEQSRVEIKVGTRKELDVELAVGFQQQDVTIGAKKNLTTDPDDNRSALVLREGELDALPNDPEELSAALIALAGVPVGPNGGQIVIDGLLNTGQPLPPSNAIREVRINANPFSAENDRLGFAQIQIITQPGGEKFRGQGAFNFNDESLNSRNPFAQNRAPYQMRNFVASLSGPIVPKRASFFIAFDQRHTDDNAIINAVVLDADLVAASIIRTVLVLRDQVNLSTRFDVQVTPNHTLAARYNYYRNKTRNAGVGGVFLPERAFNFRLPIHSLQMSETAVLNKRAINEFRLQYIQEDQISEPVSTRPSIHVLGSFASGGSNTGRSRNPESRLTVQDSILWTTTAHTLRAGARLRRTGILDFSPDDFNGSFIFAGGFAPVLDAAGEPVRETDGQIRSTLISSIERYRRTVVFSERGLSQAEIRIRGGGASQLILGVGNAEATAKQFDFGAFFQDDWRARPNLTLSFGLRAEYQTNIRFDLNLAPRVSFAWGLGSPKASLKTVIRGGFGVFFDRFNENQVLIANRSRLENYRRFIMSDPVILDSFPEVPSLESLGVADNSRPQVVFRIANDLQAPYMLQGTIGIERQLPLKTTVSASYITSRTLHALRTRNVNAPVIVRDATGEIISRNRPNGEVGDIFQYESSGHLNQSQLFVTLNNRLSPKVTFFANYTLNKAMGDTDGVGTLPANSYELDKEYGRSSFDNRHTFAAGGTFDAPLGLRLSPLIFASSGRPFNIISGVDTNEDSVFTERPGFASNVMDPFVRVTQFGAFDPMPEPGQALIPRNFGVSPSYFIVNLNVSYTTGFGKRDTSTTARPATSERPYRLTFGLRILNLFNRNNRDLPIGSLSSPFIGQSIATAGGFGAASVGNPAAGNRRIEMQIRMEF